MSNSKDPPLPVVRRAVREDGTAILALIDDLAAYEHLSPPDIGARERLLRDMFAERPRIEPYLCEIDGKAIGYALVLETYSSFLGLPTLYLEDIFVLPEYRGIHAGSTLFRAMALEAKRRGCGRMDWNVLAWNSLALDFYRRFGASHMKEWQLFRFSAEQLDAFSPDNSHK